MNTFYRRHRRCNLSDFHEMATHLRIQEERSSLMENHAILVDTDSRRAGIEQRQFSYSDYLTEKGVSIDLSILPERKIGKKSKA